MLNRKIEDALNGQVNAELYSSYLYLSMAAWCSVKSLDGFVKWLKAQALEELYHGMKIYEFIEDRAGTPRLIAIDAPPAEWDSPEALFAAVLEHEQHVTALINELINLSEKEKDHATRNFLQWYVAEQIEEESNADTALQKLKLAGKDGSGLFMIDQELGLRVFTVPIDIKTTIMPPAAGA